jgi:hypothetical protein
VPTSSSFKMQTASWDRTCVFLLPCEGDWRAFSFNRYGAASGELNAKGWRHEEKIGLVVGAIGVILLGLASAILSGRTRFSRELTVFGVDVAGETGRPGVDADAKSSIPRRSSHQAVSQEPGPFGPCPPEEVFFLSALAQH